MCLLVLFYRAIPQYPLVLCANRDEYYDRDAAPPFIWPLVDGGYPFIAPKDLRANGSWLGLNSRGAVAALTNRNTAHPRDGAPTRGELITEIMPWGSAETMSRIGLEMAGRQRYNGFNLLMADKKNAFLLSGSKTGVICQGLTPGVHLLTNEHDLNQVELADADNYSSHVKNREELISRMTKIMSSHQPLSSDGFAPCKHLGNRGTRSASLIALSEEEGVTFLYADGPPCNTQFQDMNSEVQDLFR